MERCEPRYPERSEAKDYPAFAAGGSPDASPTREVLTAVTVRNLANAQSNHVGGKTRGSVSFTTGPLDDQLTRWRVHKVSSLSYELLCSLSPRAIFLIVLTAPSFRASLFAMIGEYLTNRRKGGAGWCVNLSMKLDEICKADGNRMHRATFSVIKIFMLYNNR